MTPARKQALLKMAGVSGFNQPKRTPGHPTKSHVVVAKSGSAIAFFVPVPVSRAVICRNPLISN